jgi:hypothetical protein
VLEADHSKRGRGIIVRRVDVRLLDLDRHSLAQNPTWLRWAIQVSPGHGRIDVAQLLNLQKEVRLGRSMWAARKRFDLKTVKKW